MSENRKIFIIAGEASGDIYGGLIAKHLEGCELRGWGGEMMEAAGVAVTTHYKDLAYMGLWEVIKNIRTIKRNLDRCKREILEFNPDAIIMVDFPGFNMRIAEFAHKNGIATYQVVAPQIWAWKAGRIKALSENYNAVFPVLPFEHELLSNGGVNSQFMGHPLLEVLGSTSKKQASSTLALLPGSRKQEISKLLPVLLEAAKEMTHLKPVVAGAPGTSKAVYKAAHDAGVEVVFGKTRELIAEADLALVTSGTATLETALIGTPNLIVYKTSWFTYLAARLVVKVKYIGLPNLLLNKLIVPELIQHECTSANIVRELKSLQLPENKEAQQNQFAELRKLLKSEGSPTKRIADYVLQDTSHE